MGSTIVPERLRNARPSRVVAVIAAAIVALVPLAQALCGIDLAERSSLATAAHPHPDPSGHGAACCERLPVSVTDPRLAGDAAAAAASDPPRSFVAAPWSGPRASPGIARRSAFAAARPPPPEPAFRRVPRLLL